MQNIVIINQSYHKKLTDRHLAQINFTASMSYELWNMYIKKTNIDYKNLGRIRFMDFMSNDGENITAFGRVSHGYGYDISQDIYNSIMDSKGAK